MSPEERQLLTALFDRTRTASATPRDREAEALIEERLRDQPYATYYLAQAVIVQEKGLEAAANRIRELEERVQALEAGDTDHRRAEQGGGFLSSIFGSSQPQTQAPMPNQPGPWSGSGQRPGGFGQRGYDESAGRYAPPPPSGPWTPQAGAPSAGGSFLRGALGTAAGVAGGMLLANSLSGIFGSHMSSLGWGSPTAGANPFGEAPVEETVINNYYGDSGNEAQQADDAGFGNDDGVQDASYDQGDNGFSDDTFDSGDDSNLV